MIDEIPLDSGPNMARPNIVAAIVTGWMLFPGGEAERWPRQFITCRALLLEVYDDQSAGRTPKLPSADLLEFASIALIQNTFKPSEAEIEDRQQAGMCSGRILRDSLAQANNSDGRDTHASVIGAVSSGLPPNWLRLKKKTLQNTKWPKYKRVSHLWAAYNDLSDEFDHGDPPPTTNLITPPYLLRILSSAETFRRAGEVTHLPKSKIKTILDSNETVKLPPDFSDTIYDPKLIM